MVDRLQELKEIQTSLLYNSKVSEGSWWGSRFFARWSLKSLDSKERMHRLNLIRMFAKAAPEIRDFENDLSDKNIIDAILTIRRIIAWGESYVNTILLGLDDIVKKPEKEEYEGLVSKKIDKKLLPKEIKETSSAELYNKKKERILFIRKDILNLANTFTFFQNLSSDIRESAKSAIEKLNNDLVQKTSIFLAADKNLEAKKKIDMEETADDIIKLYEILKKALKDILKIDESFFSIKELNFILNKGAPIDNNKIAQMEQEFYEIDKIAHNVVTRWLKRKFLGMRKGLHNQSRLIAVEKLKEIGDMINPLLDKLENKDELISDIIIDIYNINKIFIRVFDQLRSFVNVYYHIQQSSKDKKDQGFLLKNVDKNNMIKSIDRIITKLSRHSGL